MSSKRRKVDNDDNGCPMGGGTSSTDVKMLNEQYFNKSYRYVKEVCDSFITKLITYYSMYSQEKCDDQDSAPVKINGEYVDSASVAVKEAKNKLNKVVNDFYQVEECFKLDNIKNWVRDVHLTPSSSKSTLLESAFLLFYTYDSHLMTVTDNDLLKYANEAADNILKYILKPGSNLNFAKDPIVKFVISPVASNTIELSFGKLLKLFGRSTEEEEQISLYTGAGIYHNGECYAKDRINKYGFRRLIPAENNVLPYGYNSTQGNPICYTDDFEECLIRLKAKFEKDYSEFELKTRIDGAALQVKEALKEIEKKYNLKYVEELIHQIDNFKSTMENESKKEGKKHEETPGGKTVHTEITHNKQIHNLTLNS